MSCSKLTVKAKEAAQMLGISESHFFNLKKSGRLGPEPKRLGRSVVYLCPEIVEWVAAGAPPRHLWQARRAASRSTTAGGVSRI